MHILVLGGTAFLGRAVATDALERGHLVTCAARGSSPPPAGAEFVAVDRDETDGLRSIASQQWDAVVDVSRQPGQVRRAVRGVSTAHWVFVSSSNVYADFSGIEQDETAATLEPLADDVMSSMEFYGAAKVACENAVRACGTTTTIVRSGLIGGPGDLTGRSGYWPWRFAHPTGADVIVPDDLDLPCALVDVRDLASWIVTAAQQRIDGTFNVTGATTTLGHVLALSKEVAHSDAGLRPVPIGQLRDLGVSSWMGPKSLPLWIDDPDWRGLATMDTRRARAAGLTLRPLRDTMADTLDFEDMRDSPRQAGLTDDEERAIRSRLAR